MSVNYTKDLLGIMQNRALYNPALLRQVSYLSSLSLQFIGPFIL